MKIIVRQTLKIKIPNSKEQEKVAKFLKNIDNKLDEINNYLEIQ